MPCSRFLALAAISSLAFSCGDHRAVDETGKSSESREPAPTAPGQYSHRAFPDAASALAAVMEARKPLVIGFGEYHQTEATRGVRSTIERFSATILPAIASGTSDLVVETWVSEGGCGEAERAVVSEVEQISGRPAQTEDENLAMLRRAKELGINPHILKMECADYEKVHRVDGGIDYVEMLELVARRLGEKTVSTLNGRPPGDGRMIAVFCGAIHNDVRPADDFETFTFAPVVEAATGGRYVEVDLYVPRFVLASESAREEPWFPLFEELAAAGGTHLIEISPDSFMILL